MLLLKWEFGCLFLYGYFRIYIVLHSIKKQSPEVFYKKGVLRNFAKFTEKYLCQRLFFNKVADLKSTILLKKSLWHSCFPVNFANVLRIYFLQNTSERLFLSIPNAASSEHGLYHQYKGHYLCNKVQNYSA